MVLLRKSNPQNHDLQTAVVRGVMSKTTMRNIVFILALLPLWINAEEDVWRPEIHFKLESADYTQTLIWVSGVSYTLSALESKCAANLCGEPKSIGSKQLLGYLNSDHAGAVITSEQAIGTIFENLKAEYPCK